MNSTNIGNNIIAKNKSAPKYELPFIKVTLAGKKNDTTHILRKVNKSKNIIGNQIDKLLFTGFSGTLDDFYKVYGRKKSMKIKKPKIKIKLYNSILYQSDVLSGPIKLTKPKEFKFMNKSKDKSFNMRILLKEYVQKKYLKFNNNKEKGKEIRNKSALNINSKTFSNFHLYNKEYFNNKRKEELEKMRIINKIRRILNLKSRNIFKNDNKSLEKSAIENTDIKENQNEEKKEIDIKEDEISENKNPKLGNSQIIKNLYKNWKNMPKSGNTKRIKKIFKKYFEKKSDIPKFKSILDPLRTGFKSSLKEMQKLEGKDKKNIWMKRSTVNLITYGTAFQIMGDDDFYKHHKRIIGVYPNIEKEANIPVPEHKAKDENLFNKLKYNEKKIRFIINDSDELLKKIKSKTKSKFKSIKPSKSQISFYKKK